MPDFFGRCISLGWMRKGGTLEVLKDWNDVEDDLELMGSGVLNFWSRQIWPISRIPVYWDLEERGEL